MNILPKKRWHVRTRENITRVRRDEAAAAEEEKKRIQKIELAEKEARTEVLRAQAREKYGYVPKKEEPKPEVPIITQNGHVNLFYELESNDAASNRKNVDHEKEAKEEREKEEMKIGYLTYLGQDTNELTGSVSWYNKAPDRTVVADNREVGMKEKLSADPLKDIRKYMETDGVRSIIGKPVKIHSLDVVEKREEKRKKKKKEKKKKSKNDSSKKKRKRSEDDSSKKKKKKKHRRSPEVEMSSNLDMEKLRAERLKREQIERQRTAALLAKLRGDASPRKKSPKPEVVQKYNSQFNPMLARQNFLD